MKCDKVEKMKTIAGIIREKAREQGEFSAMPKSRTFADKKTRYRKRTGKYGTRSMLRKEECA